MPGIIHNGAAPVEDRNLVDFWKSTEICRSTELTKAHVSVSPRCRAGANQQAKDTLLLMLESSRGGEVPNMKRKNR